MNKGSIANHLRAENHVKSLEAHEILKTAETAVAQSIQEEAGMEEHMEYLILSSTAQPKSAMIPRVPQQNEQEKEMWSRYALGQDNFNAGVDHTLAAADERKRLEREAAEFDRWHGEDFIAEDSAHDSDAELLLDELELDDILSELLRNASKYISYKIFSVIYLLTGINAPDMADVIGDDQQGVNETWIRDSDAWSPYGSKMVPPAFIK